MNHSIPSLSRRGIVSSARAAAIGSVAMLACVSGTGVSGAVTTTTTSDNPTGTVSVTFESEDFLDNDTCAALLAPASAAPAFAAQLVSGNIGDLFATLADDSTVTLLTTNGSVPLAVISPFLGLSSVTVSATEVDPNLYALITYCLNDGEPTITPMVVGDTIEAVTGSLGGLGMEDMMGGSSSLSEDVLGAVTGESDLLGAGSSA